MAGIKKLAVADVQESGNTKDVRKEMKKLENAIERRQPRATTKPQ
jgi:hypothetical protein